MYTDHFLTAALEFFQEIQLPLKKVTENFPQTYDLTSSLGITGALRGYFVLQSEIGTARNLVSGMASRLGVTFDEMDFGPFHRATIGEIVNQIAGKAIVTLETCGVNCMLTPPTIFIGKGITVSLPLPVMTMEKALQGDFGTLRFFVALSGE
ncbi:MAG: chemotaxis protein CheX [Spirochaetes bacterium]|nr:chemotaxis protein CheX [Spirochaetota bacterium]